MMQCRCKSAAKNGGFWQFRTASQLKKRIGEESLGPQDQRDNFKRLEKQYGRLLQFT